MQFPESWLRAFCNPPLSAQEIADVLTMGGLEVEELRPVGYQYLQLADHLDRAGRRQQHDQLRLPRRPLELHDPLRLPLHLEAPEH